MYRGFNLQLPENLKLNEFIKIGENIHNNSKIKIKSSLDSYLLENKSLDGSQITREWFPEIKSHIFLSHSHTDKELALTISGMLYEKFKIITFIDSTIWGYANDLLKQIDNKYCKNTNNSNYSYEKRNYSTAHVHMMLSSSLNKMIDNSECIFFLNTPNSISTSNEVENMTNSPWIYSEMFISSIIRKQIPNRSKTKVFSDFQKYLNENVQDQLMIEYHLHLSHLVELNINDFYNWLNSPKNSPEKALDNLYDNHPIIERI